MDGYYQIANGGNLFWFAEYINTVDRTANAVLTADIDLENRAWTPIGSTGEGNNNFRGHFDGQGHTITGLNVNANRAGAGLFGEARLGTVENFTIHGNVTVTANNTTYVGCVIGSAPGANSNQPDHNGATNRNITSYVNMTVQDGLTGVGRIGGFIGRVNENSAVTIRNCGAYGSIVNEAVTENVGAFMGLTNTGTNTVMENCLFAGGVTGAKASSVTPFGTWKGASKTLTNSYYINTLGTTDADATAVTPEQLSSGEIAYKLGSAWGQTIGTQNYPVLGGKKVYQGYTDCDDGEDYSNDSTISQEKPGHDWSGKDGRCVVCGTVCDHSGNQNADDGDCTTMLACSVCQATAAAAMDTHIYGNDHFCTNAGCNAEEPVYVAFYSLSLKGNIGVNYYMHIDEAIAADKTGYMSFTTPRGGTVDIPISQANAKPVGNAVYYVFTATVAAKEMTDTITGQNQSGFANAHKQGTALALFYASTLVLKTETTLRLFFRVDDTVTGFAVTRGNDNLPTTEKYGLTYVALENISAKNLDSDYTVTIHDGAETAEVTYNPMTYCYNVLNAAEGTYAQSLLDTVRALYLYNQAANAYFE